jgi:hypothetical protein
VSPVRRDAQVSANITARVVVILGTVSGNITASDSVDLRSEGSVTGDVAAHRITIEDGAFFEGGIHIGKPRQQKDRDVRADVPGNGSRKVPIAIPAYGGSDPKKQDTGEGDSMPQMYRAKWMRKPGDPDYEEDQGNG